MYPDDTDEEYREEKLMLFRRDPISFFLKLEDEKRQFFVKAILEREQKKWKR